MNEVQKTEPVLLIPWITINIADLPSRGVAYPKDAKVRYRTYSFGEVKMSSVSTPEIVQLVEGTLKGIETEGFAKDQLTFLDVLYLGVLRKVSTTQGGIYTIPFTCEECGEQGEAKFSEKSLEFTSMNEEVTELPLVVTIAGREVHWAPLTVKDFLLLQKGRWKKDIIGGEPERSSMLALEIKNMEFKEAYDLLFNLRNDDDIAVVEEVDSMLMHDLKPIESVCKADKDGRICNHTNKITLAGREAIIRPFRDGKSSARSRIRVGVSQPS